MGSTRRRQFLLAAGAFAAAGWTGADAQKRTYRLGFLAQGQAIAARKRLAGELAARGWKEGESYTFAIGATGNDPARWNAVARRLLDERVDIIVAAGSHMALLAKRATTTIPIVMMLSGNPVEAGIVPNLSRPGGNVTGLRTYVDGIWGKYVELARELLPGLQTLGVLTDYVPPSFSAAEYEYAFGEMSEAARTLGVALPTWKVVTDGDLERALVEIERAPPDALLVSGGPTHAQPRNVDRLRNFLLRRKLPMINDIQGSVFLSAGGVMAYAVSFPEIAARTASFIDRILKGAQPGDLPIEQPTKLTLVINAEAARAIGLVVPQSLLLRADQVIG